MYDMLAEKWYQQKHKTKCETIVRSEDEVTAASVAQANSFKATDQNVTITINNSDIQQLKRKFQPFGIDGHKWWQLT